MQRFVIALLATAIAAIASAPASFAAPNVDQLRRDNLDKNALSSEHLQLKSVDLDELRRENLDKNAVDLDQLWRENLDKNAVALSVQ